MANKMTPEPIAPEPNELDVSLWQAIGKFVKQCGGDVATVSDEQRNEFEEALGAWAALSVLELEDEAE